MWAASGADASRHRRSVERCSGERGLRLGNRGEAGPGLTPRAHGHVCAIEAKGFTHLPLTFGHAEQAAALPMHHRDPFDRFLIAQARIEGLTLVTRDSRIRRYQVDVLEA